MRRREMRAEHVGDDAGTRDIRSSGVPHLGVLHQHVVQRNAYVLQFEETIVDLAEAELWANITNHDT